MRTETQLQKLEQELQAIKASFEQSASSMEFYTYENTFSTSLNAINITFPQSVDPMDWTELWLPVLDSNKSTRAGEEKIVVTFDCDNNINTFAMLEIEKIQSGTGLRPISVERKIYNGGARWVVTAMPNVRMVGTSGYYEWNPNILRLVVKSSVRGQLGVKMSWQ